MKKKVLVIEDEPIIAEMMNILLEVGGYKVISLSDTTQARKKLKEKNIGLVLLDLQLRGENGQSLCEFIKGDEELKSIPVVLVSANKNLSKICKECGADACIAKPFEIDDFMAKVKEFIN